jgi:hypothetical protein
METNKEQKEPEWESFDNGMPLVILYGLIIGIIILILDALGIIKIF